MQSERQWRRIHAYRDAGNIEAARISCLALVQSASAGVQDWQLLSEIEATRGRYRAARAALVEAARHASADRAHPRLSHITHGLLAYDEWALVRHLIADADWNDREIARQAPVLAQHLSLAGDDAAARRFCDHMRGRIRPDARLEYIAGLAARNTGDAEAAEAAFERAIQLQPAFAPAHWSLAFHRPREGRAARLIDALNRVPAASDEAVELQYALFREQEAAGHTADAWQWLERAASTKRARSRPVSTADQVPSIPSIDTPLHATNVGAPIVFIVGLPRTGTTVLERILGNHPCVYAAGELNAFHAALCAAADSFLPLPSTTTTAPSLSDPDAAGRSYRAAIASLAPGGRIVVDKNPGNFLYARQIAAALPEARILCLRRNPMDACFSNLKELFPGDAYPYSYALDSLAEHYAWFDRTRAAFESAMPDRFMTVPYEAMVADPRAMSERVFAFCGLDYREGAERIEANTAPVATASSTQVREAVHRRGVDAWKRYATQLEPLRARLAALGVAA